MPMQIDKSVLREYVDACALVEETEADIRKLRRKKRTIVTTNVKGSNPEFPYEPQHFTMSGSGFTYMDDQKLRYEEGILEKRKEDAENLRLKVQEFMNTISPRMQRIIRFKYFDGCSWNEVADQLGRKCTGDSVRMELNNFLDK